MEILELKSTISEIKISLDGLNRRSQMSEERVDELEDGSIEIIQSEKWRGKKQNLMTISSYLTCTTGISRGEESIGQKNI